MTERVASRRTGPGLLRGYYLVLLALLYLPIVILFIFSINANETIIRHATVFKRKSSFERCAPVEIKRTVVPS